LTFSSPSRAGFTFLSGLVASMIAVFTLIPVPIFSAMDQFQADLPVITPQDFLLRQSIRITDRTGNEMFRTYNDENRLYLPFDQIPPLVRDAFVAIEDERFYTRSCIDMRGLARAAYATYVLEERQGGSTITQQLVRSMTGER
jgi:membrane peptidoglycan carboxypeptidase